MAENQLNRNWIAFQIINEMEIYCSNKPKGCDWRGSIEKLTQHLKSCGFEAGQMPKWLEELQPAIQAEYERRQLINESQDEALRDKLTSEEELPLAVRLYRKKNSQLNQQL